MEADFRFSLVVCMLLQQECTLQAIDFGFVPPCSSFIHDRQRFREHRQTCRWLPDNTVGVGEKRQPIGPIDLCARGTNGSQALVYLLYPFLRVPLMCQCPATDGRTKRHQVGKSLSCCKSDRSVGTLLGSLRLQAQLMEHGSPAQDKPQAKGVGTLLRQGQCLLAPREPLVRIAQVPQRTGAIAMANDTSVVPIEERSSTVLLRVIQGSSLRKMCVRRGDRSQLVQCRSQGTMRHGEHAMVLRLLRQGQELFTLCIRRLQLGTHVIISV